MAQEGSRWMWVIVFFDLPVVKKPDRKAASKFRHDLLADGFVMLQWSVYARLCNGLERANKHTNRLKQMVPPNGNVRVMLVTDQQFGRIELLVGKRLKEEEIGSNQLVLF
jgi:CRISPR-associated protein Cas2